MRQIWNKLETVQAIDALFLVWSDHYLFEPKCINVLDYCSNRYSSDYNFVVGKQTNERNIKLKT